MEAADGVQARPQPEADVRGAEGGLHPRLADERLQALRARLGQGEEAERRDHPVLAAQGNEIGDGAEAGDPQERRDRQAPAAPLGQGQGELQRQADRREIAERIGAERPVRVDLDDPRRQLAARQVVVGDDDVDAGRERALDRL